MPMEPGETTLEAVGVRKEYPDGTVALGGVDLAVRRGETVALVGESGSGKTTLLRRFNRMAEPSAGMVRVEGRPVASFDPIELRRRTGYVPQEGGLLPHWTVARNVELVPRLLGWDEARRGARTREALALVGLDPDRHGPRYPLELSGGQRQRAAFARALAGDPPVLLLDEPFGALDPLTRLEGQWQFLELKSQVGKTMLLVDARPGRGLPAGRPGPGDAPRAAPAAGAPGAARGAAGRSVRARLASVARDRSYDK